MLTSSQVHEKLSKVRGNAKTHRCIACAGVAIDWAYQYNGNPELYDNHGRPYSEDLYNCYQPMCRSCHLLHDAHKDPRIAGTLLRVGRKVGLSNATRAATDRVFAAKVILDRAKAASVANAIRRTCECGITAHPAAIGAHQKGSGHTRYTDQRLDKEP